MQGLRLRQLAHEVATFATLASFVADVESRSHKSNPAFGIALVLFLQPLDDLGKIAGYKLHTSGHSCGFFVLWLEFLKSDRKMENRHDSDDLPQAPDIVCSI